MSDIADQLVKIKTVVVYRRGIIHYFKFCIVNQIDWILPHCLTVVIQINPFLDRPLFKGVWWKFLLCKKFFKEIFREIFLKNSCNSLKSLCCSYNTLSFDNIKMSTKVSTR